jgi:hypothetical protein
MPKHPVLTKEQMKERYPNQWLLVTEYEVDSATSLRKGRVIAHSKGRDDIRRALKDRTGRLCIHFTGSLPQDTGVLFLCPE